MITPRFTCSQTAESLIISIYCPSVRASDAEINVDETLVTVHVNPYFLRLNFSKPLVEDDLSCAKYDPSSGYLTVTLTKENKGEEFQDLDLLTKLLAPRPSKGDHSPSIEVISSEDTSPEDDLASKVGSLSLEQNDILEAVENDWQISQNLPEETSTLQITRSYGFLDSHSGYLKHAGHTENEVNELGDNTEVLTREERRQARLKHEDLKWDEEYYMADFMDDEYIRELLKWEHPHIIDNEPVEYSEDEKLVMLRLPRKEYLATPLQTHGLYLTLITLLFSYIYDDRTTQHDPTPESAWTICNLTPAFSALDPPSTKQLDGKVNEYSDTEIVEGLIPSYRRVLAFPLYRSFALAEQCQRDVAGLLRKGKRTVMRCLLEMKHILDHHEVYYVYSKIWVDDFCVWVQTNANDAVLERLGVRLAEVKIDKDQTGWDLKALERSAQETVERESDSDDE